MKRPATAEDTVLFPVEHKVVYGKHAGENFWFRPSQERAHTGDDFRRGEGLDEVIVRSCG